MLPLAFTPATRSESELLESAPAANQTIFETTRSCGDPEVDQELCRKTQKEVAVRWLEGPIPFPRISSTGRVARRFGVVQGSKARPIDNYSTCQVNDSCAKMLVHRMCSPRGSVGCCSVVSNALPFVAKVDCLSMLGLAVPSMLSSCISIPRRCCILL